MSHVGIVTAFCLMNMMSKCYFNYGIVLPLWLTRVCVFMCMCCMWFDMCCVFRVWIQYRVVIHHCTTRSGIRGGGIRNLILLTLSVFFQPTISKLCALTKCLVGCLRFPSKNLPTGCCKWLLPGVVWFSNSCWCLGISKYLHYLS